MRTWRLLCLILLTAVFSLKGQEKTAAGIEFDTLTYDFGLLEKGSPAICTFDFVNKGKQPLVITRVKSSCGCMVPEWPRQPFAPGEKGSIKVQYNTQITGSFQKTIYIYTSQHTQPLVLSIQGAVRKKSKRRKSY